jgi:hypothetical protein
MLSKLCVQNGLVDRTIGRKIDGFTCRRLDPSLIRFRRRGHLGEFLLWNKYPILSDVAIDRTMRDTDADMS